MGGDFQAVPVVQRLGCQASNRLGMNQPRGWQFESGGEQSELKELVTITRLLLSYANVFTTARCYNFIDFNDLCT